MEEKHKDHIPAGFDQSHLESILNASQDKIFCVDEQYKLMYYNERFRQQAYLFDVSPELGEEVLPSDPRVAKEWKELLEKGIHDIEFTIERRYQTNDGVIRTDLVSFTPTVLNNGKGCIITAREITALKDTERALSKSERKYRKLFENSLTGVFITTLQGMFVDCNDAFAQILGYESKDEILDARVLDIYFSEDDRNHYLDELIAEGFLTNYELRHKRKDGSEVWILANVTLVEDEQHSEKMLEGTFIDITELKVASELLLESEDRFRQISEIITDYAYKVTYNKTKGDYVQNWIFGGFEQITGYDIYEILDVPSGYSNIIHQDDVPGLTMRLVENVSKGKYTERYRIHRKDGAIRWIEDNSWVVSEDNDTIEILGAVRDITEQKRYQEEIIKREESFRRLVENLPVGVAIMEDGTNVFCNPKLESIFRIQPEQDWNVLDFLPNEIRSILEVSLKNNEPVDYHEFSVEYGAGDVELVMQTTERVEGNKSGMVLILQDITTQKALVQERVRAQVLEEANKLLETEVKKHKETQKRLRTAERFSKYIIESSIDMILASDMTQQITEANHSALKRFGYALPEVLGKSPEMLYKDAEEFRKVVDSLDKKGYYRGEITNITKSGEEFNSILSASLIKDQEGNVVGAMGVSRDITEIRKSELLIEQQSSMLRSIFESSSNTLIWTFDEKYQLRSYNENFARLLKDKLGIELRKGLDIRTTIEPFTTKKENFERMYTLFQDALKGQTSEFQGPLMSKSGEVIWIEVYTNPIRSKSGKELEVACIAHDITDRKNAERTIIQSEQRNRAMLNAMPDAIIRVDAEGKVLNQRNERQGGIGLEGLANATDLEQVFGPAAGANLLRKLHQCLKQHEMVTYEFEFSEADDIVLEARFSAINDDEAIVLVRDISEEKLIENQMRESLREKEVLLKEVHHRVKNNLQIISSILNLQSSYVKDENTLEILRESQNRIKSMSFIHESLYQTKDFSSINFGEYIENLSKNLVLSYHIFDNFIETSYELEEVELNLDQAIPCGLIINELITNSLKYAFPEKKEGAKIWINLSLEGNMVRIELGDNGVGLPEGFDYRETDSLGLQLVVTLVEQLDGTIEMSRSQGTTYLITFE